MKTVSEENARPVQDRAGQEPATAKSQAQDPDYADAALPCCARCGRHDDNLSVPSGICLPCVKARQAILDDASAVVDARMARATRQPSPELLARLKAVIASDAAETGQRSWQPVDLTSVLDGDWKPTMPTVGRRSDGQGLFYPGKCHTVVSETEGGKTWFALAACLDEMQAGHHVVYADFEDDEGGMVGRLLTLGAHRDRIRERFHYLRPEGPLGSGIHHDDLRAVLTEFAPTLAVLDGITEAMTLHGLNPLDNADAATFNRLLPTKIAAAGAAVVSLDHVTKDREGRGRYAIGAAHKLNGLTGAQYLLENRTPFGIGLTGKSTVKIAKDRPGQLRKQALPSAGGLFWYGDLVLNSHNEDFTEVSIEPPHERDETWRPSGLMQRISDALASHGPLSQRMLATTVSGRRQSVIDALNFLILDGYVTEKSPHELVKPYFDHTVTS